MNIAVYLNPESAKGASGRYRAQLEQLLSQYPVAVDWIEGGNAVQSERLIRERVDSFDALIVAGGDGTVNLAINALGDSDVPLGIIAVGSGNDIAREFGLPRHRVDESLARIMTALDAGRSRSVDVMEIVASSGTRRALAIVSAGLDAAVNRTVNDLTWPKNEMRYIRGIAATLRGFRPYGARVTIDGRRQEGDVTLVSIANTRYFGGGFQVAPDARPDDQLLDVVIARGLAPRELAVLLPKLAFASHTLDPRVHVIRGREIRIEGASRYGAELPLLMADGEIITSVPATIRLANHRLTLLA